MKNLISIQTIFALILCACTSKNNEQLSGSKFWNITLKDSLGNLQIELPKYYDTLFSWIEYSDCGDPCAKIDYRIQNSHLPIFKETGFIYYPLKDSVEQFTIKHYKTVGGIPIDRFSDSLSMEILNRRLKGEETENQNKNYIIDTSFLLDSKPIAIIGFTKNDTNTKTHVEKLEAIIALPRTGIEIFFEQRINYSDTNSIDFIHKSIEAIKTIKFSDNKSVNYRE